MFEESLRAQDEKMKMRLEAWQALRAAFDDACDRLQRDEEERDENVSPISSQELKDAVWGRLPVAVRRSVRRPRFDRVFMALQMEREDAAFESLLWMLGS